jgi:hypothetical protein
MQNQSQLHIMGPEGGMNRRQCFSRYFSVDLCLQKVPLDNYYAYTVLVLFPKLFKFIM